MGEEFAVGGRVVDSAVLVVEDFALATAAMETCLPRAGEDNVVEVVYNILHENILQRPSN